jgi:hypothetical protein
MGCRQVYQRAANNLASVPIQSERKKGSGLSQALTESGETAEDESACASRWIICSTKL